MQGRGLLECDWVSRVGRFSLNWLSRILAKSRQAKEETWREEGSEEPDLGLFWEGVLVNYYYNLSGKWSL